MPAPRSTDPYRLAFLCSGDPMLLLDPCGHVEALNPAAERLVARPTAEARGAPVDDLLRPSSRPAMRFAGLAEQVIRTRLGVSLPDGAALELAPERRVEIEGRIDPLLDVDADAGEAGALLVLRDVTERRAAERSRRAREDRLCAALDLVDTGFSTWGPDERLIYENPKCQEMYAFRGPSVPPGTRLDEMLRSIYRGGGGPPGVSEETFLEEALDDFRRGGWARIIRAGDRWIRIEHIRTEDGCMATMHTDVTALKNAELALEQGQAFVRMLLDQDPNPILVKETTGEVVFANRACADLLGVKAEAIIGKSTAPVVGAQIAEHSAALEKQILASMAPVTFTHSYRCPDGEVRWFTSTRMPLLVPGAPLRVFSVSIDVTESRRHAEILGATIAELERQKQEIADKLGVIEAQQALIRELSTPVLLVAEGVLAVPVIGAMSDARAAEITSKLLGEIVRARAHHAILDVTGVDSMDAAMADAFVRMASAIQLLGARAVVTGIRPTVARSIADLGVDLRGLTTCGNLRAGLDLCLRARARA